ncbi:hypothetical protein LX64_03235 [Chitinophaga skermanii]|uniref:DUF4259 domain-containing protein n=1 Tax=Chitinophaga skermanii TaxID=331697 RepID=A0A327QC51_9BACT|nr:hypothetical protein [Chitinophaga skermanii]RAJ02226.1 hypothetical protein LX64_03235 [Chitinophaga skermanii]
MGTWSTEIHGNDTFQDIYQSFHDYVNEGKQPVDITKMLFIEYADVFEDMDDRNNALFGLALAQWETGSLQDTVLHDVKEIIESGNDLVVWMNLGADEAMIAERRVVLKAFLDKISSEK